MIEIAPMYLPATSPAHRHPPQRPEGFPPQRVHARRRRSDSNGRAQLRARSLTHRDSSGRRRSDPQRTEFLRVPRATPRAPVYRARAVRVRGLVRCGPGGKLGVTRAHDQRAALRRLHELLVALHDYRSELDTAKGEGLELVAEASRRAIRIQHTLIRSHCAATGLPRPDEVPETDT